MTISRAAVSSALLLAVTVGWVGCSKPPSQKGDTLPMDKRLDAATRIGDMAVGEKAHTYTGYCVDSSYAVWLDSGRPIFDRSNPNIERRADGYYFYPQKAEPSKGSCGWFTIRARIVYGLTESKKPTGLATIDSEGGTVRDGKVVQQ